MAEAAKTVSIKLVEKPKISKFRAEEIRPSDIVSVWRLYERNLKLTPPAYPSMHEESPEFIRAQLFNLMASPIFHGVIVKLGRRPVGMILGVTGIRPFGAPRIFLRLWEPVIEPEFKENEIDKILCREISRITKAKGLHYWESSVESARKESYRAMGDFQESMVCLTGKIMGE